MLTLIVVSAQHNNDGGMSSSRGSASGGSFHGVAPGHGNQRGRQDGRRQLGSGAPNYENADGHQDMGSKSTEGGGERNTRI